MLAFLHGNLEYVIEGLDLAIPFWAQRRDPNLDDHQPEELNNHSRPAKMEWGQAKLTSEIEIDLLFRFRSNADSMGNRR